MPRELGTPPESLYRLSRKSTGIAWPPHDLVGDGRFDDPFDAPDYRILYAGERQACFFEKLAVFRPAHPSIVAQPITRDWIASRVVSEFRIRDPDGNRRWLDLRSAETFADFGVRFREVLIAQVHQDFDLAAATSNNRELTQQYSRWAYEQGYAGIRYCTRHTPDLRRWAIFDGIELIDIHDTSLRIDDADLRAVAHAWNIALPK